MNATELYEAGQLKEAIAAQTQEVKGHPADVARRGFLCELLCFAGELERADLQLDAIGQQDPQSMLGVSLFRQLVRAEQARQQFHSDGRLPEFLDQPSPLLKLHLEASIHLREGNDQEAARVLADAEEQRTHVSGLCNGDRFDDLRDLDDLSAPFFEVLTTNGKYYWIPIARVESLTCPAPGRPRDLIWRSAHMSVRDGPDGEVFLPALYPGSHRDDDDRIRLGRATDWRGDQGTPVRGVGQRMFLVGDDDRSILSIKEIIFDQPEAE